MAADAPLLNVRRLHAVRVLVLSSDRRFLRVARVLLPRSGFDVDTVESARYLTDVVERSRSDVVIVDASASLGAAARVAGMLGALPRPVRVVTVADDPDRATFTTLRVLPKWSGFDELVTELEAAYAGTA